MGGWGAAGRGGSPGALCQTPLGGEATPPPHGDVGDGEDQNMQRGATVGVAAPRLVGLMTRG